MVQSELLMGSLLLINFIFPDVLLAAGIVSFVPNLFFVKY